MTTDPKPSFEAQRARELAEELERTRIKPTPGLPHTLRNHANGFSDFDSYTPSLLCKAADRIEELERELSHQATLYGALDIFKSERNQLKIEVLDLRVSMDGKSDE